MAFDNVYPNRKDHRKQPYGSKATDSTCRNHGSCPWCRLRREYKKKKREAKYDRDSARGEDTED